MKKSTFVKRKKDGKVFQVRCSKVPIGLGGDFNLIFELLIQNKWTEVKSPVRKYYSFFVEKNEIGGSQLCLDFKI